MDFEKICTLFTMQEPFYGILLSSMARVPTQQIPTLAVSKYGNVFRLKYNPEFVKTLDIPTTIEVLKHEMCHIAFNHFSIFEEKPKSQNEKYIRNIAMDIEVNCYLNKNNIHNLPLHYAADYGWEEQAGTLEYFKRLTRMANRQKEQASPQTIKPCNEGKGGDSPGPVNQTNNNQNNFQQTRVQVTAQEVIAQQGEPEREEEQYTDEFVQQFSEFDDHSEWPTDKEDLQAAEQIAEDMIISAAEEVEKSCGEIPAEMKGRVEAIKNKKKPKPVADWRRYVRRYLGNEFSEFVRKSKKKESLRFPDAADTRHRRKSHILVGIDTSGSISMPEYLEFFGQIKTLTSVATFDVVECDAEIQNIYPFRNKPNMEVHGGGGTSFVPVIDHFIDHKKQYDALIYFTDGCCSVPANTPKDTLWVISSKGKKNLSKFRINGASAVQIPPKQ